MTRGGVRKGAGPPLLEGKRMGSVTIRMTDEQRAEYNAQGKGAGLRKRLNASIAKRTQAKLCKPVN